MPARSLPTAADLDVAASRALRELVTLIETHLAPPQGDEPRRRARCGVITVAQGRWDGGRTWRRWDARIDRAVRNAERVLDKLDGAIARSGRRLPARRRKAHGGPRRRARRGGAE